MEEFLKVGGSVCRYVLAALSCWWFIWFLALIGQSAERSQELAGMAFGKAVISGVVAAIWFYKTRKVKKLHKPVDRSVDVPQSVGSVQSSVPPPSVMTEKTLLISPTNSHPESHSSEIEKPAQADVPMPARGWIFIGVVFAVSAGAIITVAMSKNSKPKPVDHSSIDWSAYEVKPSGSAAPSSNSTDPCPAALPSEVSSKALNAVDLPKVVGTNGKLASEQSYDSLYAPNGTAWNATLSYQNRTNSCITVAMVELELGHAGNASKERHSIVFQPILGVGETQTVSVGLRIRTPERSEDVALLGWRTISASGFASGADVPTYDENGFQIVNDEKDDPFAAYGGHLIKVDIPEDVASGRLLQKTEPLYPPIAKAARVSGTVVLHATISKTGSIKALSVLTGPDMLKQASIDAVKTWKYKPYIVNNQPVEVETTVNVIFALGD